MDDVQEAVETDARLLRQARGSRPAVVQLWNRYYVPACMASAGTAEKTLAATFRKAVDKAGRDTTGASDFATEWLGAAAVPPPSRRAVLWAFYTLSPRNRTIVWRLAVDGWELDQLVEQAGLPAGTVRNVVRLAGSWFAFYLAHAQSLGGVPGDAVPARPTGAPAGEAGEAAGPAAWAAWAAGESGSEPVVAVDVPSYSFSLGTTNWRQQAETLTRGVLGVSLAEYAAREDWPVDSETVINPPLAPELSPRGVGTALWERARRTILAWRDLIATWWWNLGAKIRVALGAGVAALLVVSTGALVMAWGSALGSSTDTPWVMPTAGHSSAPVSVPATTATASAPPITLSTPESPPTTAATTTEPGGEAAAAPPPSHPRPAPTRTTRAPVTHPVATANQSQTDPSTPGDAAGPAVSTAAGPSSEAAATEPGDTGGPDAPATSGGAGDEGGSSEPVVPTDAGLSDGSGSDTDVPDTGVPDTGVPDDPGA
ncbi:MAG: hypothetical protein LBI33_08620 [Propionibacteriaceae bacterium]|jgi:hypothetical protein|nr:hypothetical protein [Propionibacteriaceae bacterium]